MVSFPHCSSEKGYPKKKGPKRVQLIFQSNLTSSVPLPHCNVVSNNVASNNVANNEANNALGN